MQRLYFFSGMHIFYQPDLSAEQILLDEEESKHCVRVLRMQKGDEVQLLDGKGTSAIAQIVDDHPKRCALQIVSTSHTAKSRKYTLHIAVAPTKHFDRIEWFIEKSVEVGIDEITFIECEHSERAKVNLERCEKVAVAAMKQSKQAWLPKINPLTDVKELLKAKREGASFIAWCETGQEQTLDQLLPASPANDVTIFIGPEGDFTRAEVALALGHKVQPLSFGSSRLRTETAALYACIAMNVLRA